MTDPSFIYDERDRRDEELEQREPPLDWAAYDPTLTEEQAEELAAAVNRYAPCAGCKFQDGDYCKMLPWNDVRYATPWEKYQAWQGKQCDYIAKRDNTTPRPRLTEAQERARGELARRLADGENVPMSLFM